MAFRRIRANSIPIPIALTSATFLSTTRKIMLRKILAAMKLEDKPEMERAFHGALYVPVGFSGDLSKIT